MLILSSILCLYTNKIKPVLTKLQLTRHAIKPTKHFIAKTTILTKSCFLFKPQSSLDLFSKKTLHIKSKLLLRGGFSTKKKTKRSILRYLFRPIVILTGQSVIFNWSLKKQRVNVTYGKFLKTQSIKNVSRTMLMCLVLKEPSFFLIPYANMLTDLDMFTHRRLLRLAQSSLYWYSISNFGLLLGFYFSCAGKISVGGNSRTRTMLKSYGYISSSLVSTQTTNSFATVNTVTGCLGLLLVFFY